MDWHTLRIVIVLALVVVVFFGFVRERMTPDVVALSAVAALLATGILDIDDALKVFSNSAPITVGAMFVLSAALERTGVIDTVGRAVVRAARWSPASAAVVMMIGVMAMSAFINNTPVVVIFTPVVIGLAKAMGVPPTKLLIPLSFCAILGGTTTLIGTSTNILVDGVAQRQGLAPFGIFETTAAGAIMAAVGLAYLLVVGRWLLPARDTLADRLPDPSARHFVAEVLVPPESPLVGRKPADAGYTEERGVQVLDVIRDDLSLRYDLMNIELRAGDRIVLQSKVENMLGLREAGEVEFGTAEGGAIIPLGTQETVLMEGVVAPRSRLVGRRVAELNLRRAYGVYIMAIHRRGESLSGKFEEVRLRSGDTLLLEGPPESMQQLFEYQELINLMQPQARPLRRGKAPIAVAAVTAVVVLAGFDVLPIVALALIGATAVIAFGCIEADDAYRSIHWNILMLIFGMLALGVAMERTGAAKLVVDGFAALIGGAGPIVVLSALYLVASLLTEIMSNNAAAILLTPIAVGLAGALGVDARPLVVAIMFAASASFATPIGYQTNTFVYNAGGYRFTDFVKVGLPLNLLLWAVATAIIPVFWPF